VESDWQRYDSDERFALQFPGHWAVDEQPPAGVAVSVVAPLGSDETFRPNVNVLFQEWQSGDLDEAARASIGELERFMTDLRVLDYEETSVGDRPARRLLSTYRQGLYSLTLEQWYVAADDKLAVVSATSETPAYDRVADTLEAVATSLELE
jgi:hypothetical protein